jgi:hypothetical protein
LQGFADGRQKSGNIFQFAGVATEKGHELPSVPNSILDVPQQARGVVTSHLVDGPAEGQGKGQLCHYKARVHRLGGKFQGVRPKPVGGKRRFKDAGRGKKRAGYDLADIAGIETQALVQFGGTGVGLRPGGKLPKLLLDNGAGAIFHGATNSTAVSPILSGESKSWLYRLHLKAPRSGLSQALSYKLIIHSLRKLSIRHRG